VVGNLVFVAGTVGKDVVTGTWPVGIQAQMEQALKNLAAILAEAGCTLADVVKTTTFITPEAVGGGGEEVCVRAFADPKRPILSCCRPSRTPSADIDRGDRGEAGHLERPGTERQRTKIRLCAWTWPSPGAGASQRGNWAGRSSSPPGAATAAGLLLFPVIGVGGAGAWPDRYGHRRGHDVRRVLAAAVAMSQMELLSYRAGRTSDSCLS
jgi:Endoribonuclease L-PSP